MVSRPYMYQHREPAKSQNPHYGIQNDLDYKDTVFVYPVTMLKNDFNEDIESWADKPIALRCSYQEQAIDSQDTEPARIPNRFSKLYTRYRGFVKWHDKVICRGIEMMVVEVLERFDNVTGQFHHTQLRARFLSEPGSVNRG